MARRPMFSCGAQNHSFHSPPLERNMPAMLLMAKWKMRSFRVFIMSPWCCNSKLWGYPPPWLLVLWDNKDRTVYTFLVRSSVTCSQNQPKFHTSKAKIHKGVIARPGQCWWVGCCPWSWSCLGSERVLRMHVHKEGWCEGTYIVNTKLMHWQLP